jgi:hypothetical protein
MLHTLDKYFFISKKGSTILVILIKNTMDFHSSIHTFGNMFSPHKTETICFGLDQNP